MENRKSGFYWVIYDNEISWEVAEFTEHGNWMLTGSELIYIDSELKEIDERQIVRATQREQHIFPNPEFIELKDVGGGVKDLTKPMGYDMNKFQRNFYDSSI